MKQINKIRICLLLNIFLLFFISSFVTNFAGESKYFRFGPNQDFIFISVPIDNYNRYSLLLILIFFNDVIKVLISEIGEPILVFNVYNPDKLIITDFTKYQLLFYSNSMFFISNIRRIFEILISITQIDIALFSIINEQIVCTFAIYFLVNEKKFSREEDTIELNNEDTT